MILWGPKNCGIERRLLNQVLIFNKCNEQEKQQLCRWQRTISITVLEHLSKFPFLFSLIRYDQIDYQVQ